MPATREGKILADKMIDNCGNPPGAGRDHDDHDDHDDRDANKGRGNKNTGLFGNLSQMSEPPLLETPCPNKLAKLGDAKVISKSETINH